MYTTNDIKHTKTTKQRKNKLINLLLESPGGRRGVMWKHLYGKSLDTKCTLSTPMSL